MPLSTIVFSPEIGQIARKQLFSAQKLARQSVNNCFQLRNWLDSLSTTVFSLEIGWIACKQLFSAQKLAGQPVNNCFPPRNWLDSLSTIVFSLEIGWISCQQLFSAQKLARQPVNNCFQAHSLSFERNQWMANHPKEQIKMSVLKVRPLECNDHAVCSGFQ